MSEIDTRVVALRFELGQIATHTDQGFRDRVKEIEAELAEWEAPDAPTEVAPSEDPTPHPAADAEPAVESSPDADPPKDTK